MTKADVLSTFKEVKVCTAYQHGEQMINELPFDLTDQMIPAYKSLKGWSEDLTQISSTDEFPPELMDYITYLEDVLETPISIVSVGPDRNQTILRDEILA
jgi:adenylosuccinate synthase